MPSSTTKIRLTDPDLRSQIEHNKNQNTGRVGLASVTVDFFLNSRDSCTVWTYKVITVLDDVFLNINGLLTNLYWLLYYHLAGRLLLATVEKIYQAGAILTLILFTGR